MRKKRRKRVILLFVVTFLITLTVGLSGVVIYHALQNRQTQDTFSEREIATGEGSVTSGDAAGEKCCMRNAWKHGKRVMDKSWCVARF